MANAAAALASPSVLTALRLRKRVVHGVCLHMHAPVHTDVCKVNCCGENTCCTFPLKRPVSDKAPLASVNPLSEQARFFLPDGDDLATQDAHPTVSSSLAPIKALSDSEGTIGSQFLRRDTQIVP